MANCFNFNKGGTYPQDHIAASLAVLGLLLAALACG
jgi:hypothetical protein